MEDTIFYTVLNMSIIAAFTGLIVILLRKIGFIPRKAVYALWILVLLRLLLPFYISSRFSLINLTGNLVKRVVKVPVLPEGQGNVSMLNSIGAARSYFPTVYKTDRLAEIFHAAALIWLAVALCVLIFLAVLYFISYRQLRNSAYYRDNIYVGRGIDAPIVHGIFNPRILIPGDYAGKKELNYIILHETVHIKRHDNFLRLLALAVACVHWFNPMVWIFLKLFIEDMELTCDLKAIESLSFEERKQYAAALVDAGKDRQLFMPAFGRSGVRSRVLNVLSYKRLSVLAVICTAIFIAAIGAVLMTNPLR